MLQAISDIGVERLKDIFALEKSLGGISVVISTYTKERFRYLSDCIRSLKRQTLPPREIILVLDPYEELVRFYKSQVPADIRLVVSEKPGLSYARNVGVKNARGGIVAFIDDDAIADEKWLENMIRNYEDPYVLSVGGLVKPLWEKRSPKWFPEELNWIVGCSYKGLPESRTSIRNHLGCNMSFRKFAFEKAGVFRTDIGRAGNKLSANEDTEFCIRVAEKFSDYKILYDPTSFVCHRVPNSRANLKYVARRSFSEGISKATISKNKSNPTKMLAVECNYFKNLLSRAIPKRLIHCYKPENFSQFLALILSTSLVLLGYLAGKIMKTASNSQ